MSTKLTEPQRKIMMAIMRDDFGAACIGKSASALNSRLQVRGMLRWATERKTGRQLTEAGFEALRTVSHSRWARSGCKAYQDDLNEVEAAILVASGDGQE